MSSSPAGEGCTGGIPRGLALGAPCPGREFDRASMGCRPHDRMVLPDAASHGECRLDAEIDDAVAMPIPDQSSAPQQAVKPKKKPKGTGRLALKTLARELLGREIQTKDRLGHDSLEDAIAARDLAHWYVTHPSNVQTTTVDPSINSPSHSTRDMNVPKLMSLPREIGYETTCLSFPRY